MYEMEFRQYDPAIARFTSIDPITHHSLSTYNAFDNNPIYWADPSGADAINLDGNTLSINWNEVDDGEEGSTWNSTEPKEGQTREAEVPDGSGRHGDGKSIQTQYYHAGGVNGSDSGWYSGHQYAKRIAPVALNLARYLDGGSLSGMEITGSYDQFLSFMSSRNTSDGFFEFLLSYGRSLNIPIPKANGQIKEDNISTLAVFFPAFRALGNTSVPVYRVFGGGARAEGYSWSLINPRLYGNSYRNLAGLPKVNSAEFMLSGSTKLNNILKLRLAKPIPKDGVFGRGVPEVIANPNNVTIKSLQILKN